MVSQFLIADRISIDNSNDPLYPKSGNKQRQNYSTVNSARNSKQFLEKGKE